jgi:hypothetical protein
MSGDAFAGDHVENDDGAKFAVIAAEERQEEENRLSGELVARWNVRTLEDALKDTSEGPPWVIKDLLLKDTATLVSAHPHSMKSLSLLCACIEAVAKKQVWGHFAAPSVTRALFIETEDPEWMVASRVRGFARGFDLHDNLPGFFYACVGAFDLVGAKDQIIQLLKHFRPDFAVLSTLQGLLGGRDWLRQNEMSPVNAMFVEISRSCCPLIVVTHSPWNKKDRRAAGTITQAANFVTNVHFQKTAGKDSFVHVSIDSKVGANDSDFSLKLNTDGDEEDHSAVRSFAFAGEGWPKGLRKHAVIEALENDPDAPSKEIASRVGCGKRYVQRIRKTLSEEDEE